MWDAGAIELRKTLVLFLILFRWYSEISFVNHRYLMTETITSSDLLHNFYSMWTTIFFKIHFHRFECFCKFCGKATSSSIIDTFLRLLKLIKLTIIPSLKMKMVPCIHQNYMNIKYQFNQQMMLYFVITCWR